jgi:hypothetical protein
MLLAERAGRGAGGLPVSNWKKKVERGEWGRKNEIRILLHI